MDAGALNSFLDQFLAIADAGFGLIGADVRFVLNALILISITLAGAQWALAGEPPVAPFFRKVLFAGLFAFLVNNWRDLTSAAVETGAMLGLKAGGGAMDAEALHDPGRVADIGVTLFGRAIALAEGMNILTDFATLATVYLAAVCVLVAFATLALQLFVTLVAFKLGSLAAFVALPWGVFNGTAWVAERPLGWVAGSAIRLFVLALVASIALAFVDGLPPTLTLEEGGAVHLLIFGLTIFALAWFAPALAGEVMQGQPNLSANDATRLGAVTAVSTGLAARQAVGLAGAGVAQAGAIVRALGAGARRSGGLRGSGGRAGGSGATPAYGAMQPRPRSGGAPPASERPSDTPKGGAP